MGGNSVLLKVQGKCTKIWKIDGWQGSKYTPESL